MNVKANMIEFTSNGRSTPGYLARPDDDQQYPAVVVILHHQHHIMLQRNLLYTAMTRGRRLVTVVGSRRALGRAVSNNTVRHRHTMLAERLKALGD